MDRICLNCDAAHDPFARIENKDTVYSCRLCGKEICVTCEEDHAQEHIERKTA